MDQNPLNARTLMKPDAKETESAPTEDAAETTQQDDAPQKPKKPIGRPRLRAKVRVARILADIAGLEEQVAVRQIKLQELKGMLAKAKSVQEKEEQALRVLADAKASAERLRDESRKLVQAMNKSDA